MSLTEINNKDTFSAEDIISIFTLVGMNKDIILIKNDGLREAMQYSVIIIPSENPVEGSLRCDDKSLNGAMKNVLSRYLQLSGKQD